MTPVGDIIIGTIATLSCFQMSFISIPNGVYFSIFSSSFFSRFDADGIAISMKNVVFCCLRVYVMSGLLCDTVLSVCSVVSQ